MIDDQTLRRAIDERRELMLAVLFRLLRQPSISTQGIGVPECALLVRDVLAGHGVRAEILPTAGFPVVVGDLQAGDDANTVLVYGHYDVQPPEPLEAWDSPPFEPTIRDGRKLTFTFPDVAADSATLLLRWGTTAVPLHITVLPSNAVAPTG